MKILVANLGSTSFKFRLLDMVDQTQLARGGVDRIGSVQSRCRAEIGSFTDETTRRVSNHADALDYCFQQLTDPEYGCLANVNDVAGVGFKTVHGGRGLASLFPRAGFANSSRVIESLIQSVVN